MTRLYDEKKIQLKVPTRRQQEQQRTIFYGLYTSLQCTNWASRLFVFVCLGSVPYHHHHTFQIAIFQNNPVLCFWFWILVHLFLVKLQPALLAMILVIPWPKQCTIDTYIELIFSHKKGSPSIYLFYIAFITSIHFKNWVDKLILLHLGFILLLYNLSTLTKFHLENGSSNWLRSSFDLFQNLKPWWKMTS